MTTRPAPVQIDSWQTAERNAAAWMRFWGYLDAQVTPPGRDGGIDVSSTDALGQVKFEAAQVGAPAVQRLVGARGRDHHKDLFFFSGAGFAAPAVAYADSMDVALFKFDLLGQMEPMSSTARRVAERSGRVEVDPEMVQKVEVVTSGGSGGCATYLAGALGVFLFVCAINWTRLAFLGERSWIAPPLGFLLSAALIVASSRLSAAREDPEVRMLPDPLAFFDVAHAIAEKDLLGAAGLYAQHAGVTLREAKAAVAEARLRTQPPRSGPAS